MPASRGSFPVATTLILILAGLAAIRTYLQSAIPALPLNRNLENAPGEYIRWADRQPIRWQQLSDANLKAAEASGKPILVVIGTPWSEVARDMDAQVFKNRDVANMVNENFVPFRVDGLEEPRWLSTFLPIERLKMPDTSGFQAYVLGPHRGGGAPNLLAYLGPNPENPDLNLDPNSFLDSLNQARSSFADSFSEAATRDQMPDTVDQQVQDVDQLLAPPVVGTTPAFLEFARYTLQDAAPAPSGGFALDGIPRLLPMTWLFQLRADGLEDMSVSLDPVLLSSATDLVRGGFFGYWRASGRTLIDFDEVTTRNAEMAALLAEAWARQPNPLYRLLAIRTFDMLASDLRADNLFYACRESDRGHAYRSPSASFPDSRLSRVLSKSDWAWAQRNLGLDVTQNPQMVPLLESPAVLNDRNLDRILRALKAATPTASEPKVSERNCLDVSGHTAAYLLRCARLLGDQGRIQDMLGTVDALEEFKKGQDVAHSLETGGSGEPYLGDYLAYADAKLADFLCSGRVVSLEAGEQILERALGLFKSGPSNPGLFTTAPTLNTEGSVLPQALPQITDDATESCTAQLIRLLTDYGRLLEPAAVGQDLLHTAGDVIDQCASLELTKEQATRLRDLRLRAVKERLSEEDQAQLDTLSFQLTVSRNPRLGGYYAAAAAYTDLACAFAVGPKAQQQADQLYRMRPSRLVAAAFGPVRPDLQSRQRGIYISSTEGITGPLTVEEAVKQLQPNLQVLAGQ